MRFDPDSAGRAFAAFRRDGDVRSLTAAFDATAPELLRVAAFLVPRDLVEDAVHDTFRVALERRADYQADRPLLPWLLGMLANEARTLRRRERRRARELPAPVPAPVRDPVAAACDRETEAAFTAALQRLDRDDAQLLQQHLVEDLSCREIAERERRPAGTVRTQVARAMAELRSRLPVGLAIAPGFGIADPARLVQVRARVLAGVPPPAAAALWWLRPRAWIAVVGAAVAGIAAAVWFARAEGPTMAPVASATARHGAQPVHGDRTAATVPLPTAGPAVERVAVAVPAPRWVMRGVVAGEDGVPLAGARVRCRFEEMGRVLSECTSDPDGRYELDLGYWRDRPPLDRSGRPVVAVAEAPGCSTRTVSSELPTSAVDEPLVLEHDFTLFPYRTVRGRAVDRFGAPVAARVMAFGPEPLATLHASGTADEQGVFRLVLTDADPRLMLDLRDPLAGRVRREVEVPPTGELDAGDLVLAPGHRISGRVSLTDGTPLPDLDVQVRGGLELVDGLPVVGPDYWYHGTTTDADGRFVANRGVLDRWACSVHGPLGLGIGEPGVDDARWVPAENDTADFSIDGVRLDLSWWDPEGRELLPRGTRVVVFAADDAEAARAARGGDAEALARALADERRAARHLVVPRGAHVWLRVEAAGRFGADELVTMPMRNAVVPVRLGLSVMPSTQVTIRVRFDDGGVPERLRCKVTPRAGASLHAFAETGCEPGLVRGRCAVGPVHVEVSAYPDLVVDEVPLYHGVVETRDAVAMVDRDNEFEVVLARRGTIRFVVRDAAAPDRVVTTDEDTLDGDVTIDGAVVGAFWWCPDPAVAPEWGGVWLGRPVETRLRVPIGHRSVTFAFAGYEPQTVPFVVTEAPGDLVTVWLQPR